MSARRIAYEVRRAKRKPRRAHPLRAAREVKRSRARIARRTRQYEQRRHRKR